MPLAASEACLIVEMDARPTITELDTMPQSLIDTILLYKMVRSAIETGAEVDL